MILRCTGKLLKVLGVRPRPDEPSAHSGDLDWYANLLWFDRRKCVLLTHARTLFSVFIPDVRKEDVTPVGPFVVRHIEDALAAEALPMSTLGPLDPASLQIARTASRSILGCMNDMAWMIENDLLSSGGLGTADIAAVNHRLRRTINSPSGYQRPIDLARVRVGSDLRDAMESSANASRIHDANGP